MHHTSSYRLGKIVIINCASRKLISYKISENCIVSLRRMENWEIVGKKACINGYSIGGRKQTVDNIL